MPTPIEYGADEIAKLMKDRDEDAVAERLRADYLHMSPQKFNELLTEIQKRDTTKDGVDLLISDEDGDGKFEATLADYSFFGLDREDTRVIGNAHEMKTPSDPLKIAADSIWKKHPSPEPSTFIEQRK